MLQTFRTASTVWTVNTDERWFIRTPRAEGFVHPTVEYSSIKEDFLWAKTLRRHDGLHTVYFHMSDPRPYRGFIRSGALLSGESFDDTDTREII